MCMRVAVTSLERQVNLTPDTNSLIDRNFGWDLRPKTGVFDGCDLLLRVTVHVHVQHQAAERGSEVKGQVLIGHGAQDQIHIQLT